MKSVHSHQKKQGLNPGQCYSVAKYKMKHVFNNELYQLSEQFSKNCRGFTITGKF